MSGIKFDQGKPDFTLLPTDALEEIAKGFMVGAKKYGEWNWTGGMKHRRIAGALLRHVFAWLRGEDLDPETGVHHLGLAGCNVLMLMASVKRGIGTDDRHKCAATPESQS